MTDVESVKGVGPQLAKQLRAAFICTAEVLAVQNPVDLQARSGITEGKVKTIIENARELTKQGFFKSGADVENEELMAPRLLTGIKKVDDALLGGIPEGAVIEFYGPAKGGKTQWCHFLALRTQLPLAEGGLDGRVLWMDTEASFKTWIVRANALRWNIDPKMALGNIRVARFVHSSQIEEAFDQLPQLIENNGIKMVVVDSLSSLYRVEYTKLNDLKLRQQRMNWILNTMRRIGLATGVVFVYTNQVMDKIGQGGSPSIINQPIGGHILAHGSDFRFYTTKAAGTDRTLKLLDNAGVPAFQMALKFGWGGFYDDINEKKAHEERIVEELKRVDRFGFARAQREIIEEAIAIEPE